MSSEIWLYFDLKPADHSSAICKQCKITISRGSSLKSVKFWGNGALINHIKRHHSTIFAAYKQATRVVKETKKSIATSKKNIYALKSDVYIIVICITQEKQAIFRDSKTLYSYKNIEVFALKLTYIFFTFRISINSPHTHTPPFAKVTVG
jgi:hypothetical protein